MFEDGVKRVIVKYDPRDLSYIFVRKPSGRFVKAYQETGAEVRILNECSETGAQSKADGVYCTQPDPSILDSCGEPSNNVIEMVVVQRQGLKGLAQPHNDKPSLAVDSVAQIERRCGTSCPFSGKPGHVIARNSAYSC